MAEPIGRHRNKEWGLARPKHFFIAGVSGLIVSNGFLARCVIQTDMFASKPKPII